MSFVMFLSLLLLIFAQLCMVSAGAVRFVSTNSSDQSSLLAFKSAIKIDPYHVLSTNWTEQSNFCDWVGVLCSRRHMQRVTGLNLSNMSLAGTISPHLGNLSFLVVLDLRNNSFHGRLVDELGNLRRLKVLALSYNNLEGAIPSSLFHCRNLRVISLSYNRFTGGIPKELSTLPSLSFLTLAMNNLTGNIPPSLVNMSSLLVLGLAYNNFHGNIPSEIAPNLLEYFAVQYNNLTGSIPPSLFNVSSLEQIVVAGNALSGHLPVDTGRRLPNLLELWLGSNQLSGTIPSHLSNCSMLTVLDLFLNQFSGPVPTSLGHLESLQHLNLGFNQLQAEPKSQELSFITGLTSLRSLVILIIQSNPFHGSLPDSIDGNLSSGLQMFLAASCQLKGRIPEGIGALRNLNLIDLGDNSLGGTIPSTIKEIRGLQRMMFGGNKLEGNIPSEICLLSNLGEIYLEGNNLSGPIPGCIGNLSDHLQLLYLGSNKLNSTIPSSLWRLDSLVWLNLSMNSFSGDLGPEFSASRTMVGIDLSRNQMSVTIPSTLGALQSLTYLDLSRNSYWGPVPDSFGNLIALDFLDLSNNNLSGPIPKSLAALSHLSHLNLSRNNLSGEIPSGGPFPNFTAQSFLENAELCGLPLLRPCAWNSPKKSKTKHYLTVYVPAAIAAVVVIGALLFMLKTHRESNAQSPNSGSLLDPLQHERFSYHELSRATNNFCEANVLGLGSFGSVYMGTLPNGGGIVAVKLLNLKHEGAIKSFEAECSVLRTVRHRNLVRVISACTNPELRALVLQYMSNGSLEKWLYSDHNHRLDLLQRVSIMLDVALALEYLHHGHSEPVVHCDLKPSNVLLDEDMVAHVADFGIAKILAANKTETQTKTMGTFGYIAPEYGTEGRVSTKGDVYSYGILLLETFTRKKPVDEMFDGELSLKQWVSAHLLHDMMMEVVDASLLASSAEAQGNGTTETAIQQQQPNDILSAVLVLGLGCCKDLPEERSEIKDVAVKLNKIKLQIIRDRDA